MSISLDVALYLREQKDAVNVTVGERGFLLTLCFRLGSNSVTWVSQEDLAIELDIIERNVRRYAASLAKKGLIVIEKDPNDKRRNRYKVSKFLINYHQLERVRSKQYRSKKPCNNSNIGQKRPMNIGQKRPIPASPEIAAAQAPCGLTGNDISPKVKYKSNTKEKVTLSCSSGDEPGVDFQQSVKKQKAPLKTVDEKLQDIIKIYPRMEKKKTVMELWKRKKLDRTHNAIMADIKSRLAGEWKYKDPKFIPMLATYLAQERWNDAPLRRISKPENKPFSLNTSDMVSNVPFWGPGHPSYDSLYSARVG